MNWRSLIQQRHVPCRIVWAPQIAFTIAYAADRPVPGGRYAARECRVRKPADVHHRHFQPAANFHWKQMQHGKAGAALTEPQCEAAQRLAHTWNGCRALCRLSMPRWPGSPTGRSGVSNSISTTQRQARRDVGFALPLKPGTTENQHAVATTQRRKSDFSRDSGMGMRDNRLSPTRNGMLFDTNAESTRDRGRPHVIRPMLPSQRCEFVRVRRCIVANDLQ